MQSQIDIACVGQRLTPRTSPIIATGGINNVRMQFELDETWKGLDIKAVFENDSDYTQEPLDSNYSCLIPALFMIDKRTFNVSVYGTLNNELRQTSTVLSFTVEQGTNMSREDAIEAIRVGALNRVKSDIIATLTQIYTDYEVENVPNFEEMSIDELVNDLISNTTMIVDGLARDRITEQTKTAIVDCLTQIAEYYDLGDTDYAEMSVYQLISTISPTLDAAALKVLNQANDKDITELRGALQTLTNEDFSGVDFNGLCQAVTEIPIITDVEQTLMDDWSVVKTIIENSELSPKALWDNRNHITVPYSVPYLRTAKMKEDGSLVNFNANLESVGFDLSSAPQNWLTSSHTTRNTPFYTATALKFIKITGCESQNSFIQVFLERINLEEVELYGVNKNHNLTNTFSYVFSNCTSLHTISGEPLDMTGVSSMYDAFSKCNELRNIRFKPDSIATDVNFASCANLTQESILSIINGLSHPARNIRFPSTIKTNLSVWKCEYGENSLLEMSESPDAMTLQFAITQKGWTIA